MPGKDPAHWLLRLDAGEWLDAAETDLGHGEAVLGRRDVRAEVTHARRAAGMAVNALLVGDPHDRWGRSYMDHVRALVDDPTVPAEIRAAALALRDTPPRRPDLVTIGKPDRTVLDAAATIIGWARRQCRAKG